MQTSLGQRGTVPILHSFKQNFRLFLEVPQFRFVDCQIDPRQVSRDTLLARGLQTGVEGFYS